MELRDKYDKLYNDSTYYIKNNNIETDSLIDSTIDSRYGITLLIRPNEKVKERIQNIIADVKFIEPDQYYYPGSDIHLTILSIISCYEGFNLKNLDIFKYSKIVSKCAKSINSFKITLRGITASSSCVMIQGFPDNSNLKNFRDKLRFEFSNSSLEQSLDKRYEIQTAHLTIIRFRKKLKKKTEFLELLEKFREYEFGTINVNSVELVSNDWYQRKDNVKVLDKFQLSNY